MRRKSRMTIVAALAVVVAAWASPARTEPWDAYHHGHYRGHWHHGCPMVYVRPWYPGYGPLVVVSGVHPSHWQLADPIGVREVRLHGNEGSPHNSITKGRETANNGPPRKGLDATSSRANPDRGLATRDSLGNASVGFFTPAHPTYDDGWRPSSIRTPPAPQNSAATIQSALDEALRAFLSWLAPPLSPWTNP